MRVLHFVPRLCWPLNTGAKLRNYHLAREIARRARITLLTFSENGDEANGSSIATQPSSHNQPEAAEDSGKPQPTEPQTEPSLVSPEHFYERVITVRREQGYTPAKILRGALGQTPLPVLNYTTTGMKQALERVLSEQDFDFVQVESIHLLSYLPIIRAAQSRPRIILDWHNIESELMWRYSERSNNILRRTYARRTSRQLNNLERRAVSEFDAHVVVSERDGAKLLEHDRKALVFLIENGVDTAYYSDELIEQAHKLWRARKSDADTAGDSSSARRESSNSIAPHRISFVGSMDYHANADAAVNFAQEVWPKLLEQKPELVFTIVGRDPAPEVRRLAEIPGVEVTGTVDDVRPYYRETLAAVIPLRVGGGSRLKILEAMAAGVAVVSTTLGAEGLDVEDGENILIADTSRDLSEAIITIAEDEERRKKLCAAGRALVFEQYDWSRLGAALFETYRNLYASKSVTPIEQ
jgi:glycosyltransferase involved in cell wall biosynthesis